MTAPGYEQGAWLEIAVELGEGDLVWLIEIFSPGNDRFIGCQIRQGYLAPEVLRRIVYQREVRAVTLLELVDCVELPWCEPAEVVFA